MKKFISDLFREKTGGKISSKKFFGNIFLTLCALTFVVDLFNPTLVAGCTLIGLRTIGGMFK